MGGVYTATHVMLGKTVAVKLINPELVTSPEVVRRFQREARAATALNHPNIVAVFDLGQTAEGTLYIAMEFVDGPSLKAAISAGGPMAPARAVTLMRQIGNALSMAHRNKIIHRDLKPQNIMLARSDDGQEIAKLVDFGIAKTFDEATQLTMAGDAIGTPHYMAPEQAAGQPVDARSDLYSAGIILYEMLSGEVPFNDTSAPAILIKHLQEIPQPPSVKNAEGDDSARSRGDRAQVSREEPGGALPDGFDELCVALDQAAASIPGAAAGWQSQATALIAANVGAKGADDFTVAPTGTPAAAARGGRSCAGHHRASCWRVGSGADGARSPGNKGIGRYAANRCARGAPTAASRCNWGTPREVLVQQRPADCRRRRRGDARCGRLPLYAAAAHCTTARGDDCGRESVQRACSLACDGTRAKRPRACRATD